MKVTGRKAEVLRALQDARGFWVGGPALANVACGGSEGLRRLRELRELGYDIEKRKVHPSHKYYSYRLLRLADIYDIDPAEVSENAS